MVEVASNDGYLLRHVAERGVRCLGIEPAANVAEAAVAAGVPTEVTFLAAPTGADVASRHGRADLVVANNVFAHVPDIVDFTAGLRELLADDGTLTIEIPHLLRLIEGRAYDTIYHEHYSYVSLLTTQRVLATAGLTVVDVEELPSHGGSLRTWSTPTEHAGEPSAAVAKVLADEEAAGLHTLEGHAGFAAEVARVRDHLVSFLSTARGAAGAWRRTARPGKGNTLLNHAGVKRDQSPSRSTATRSSTAGSCRAPKSPCTTSTGSPRSGPTTSWSCRGTCARRSRRSCRTSPTGAASSWSSCPTWRSSRRRSGRCGSGRGGGAVKVVLFCGGLGMRMRTGPESLPKPMMPIGSRPVLWHVMRYYAHFGHREFILCLGHGSQAVKDYFLDYRETRSNDFVLRNGGRDIEMLSTDISDWTITFADTGIDAAIGERLRRVRHHLDGDEMFLANYGDVLTDAPMDEIVEGFAASDAVGSMLTVKPQDSFHVVGSRTRR